jgi:hypothetical protein
MKAGDYVQPNFYVEGLQFRDGKSPLVVSVNEVETAEQVKALADALTARGCKAVVWVKHEV